MIAGARFNGLMTHPACLERLNTEMKTYDNHRRRFLKTALLATGAFMASPMGMARAQSLSGKKIIVVGAGVSGLAAAQSLSKQGADVTIIEAKSYIGGRLRTNYSMGVPFEYGAGWIHGPSDNNPVKDLADAVGAKTTVTDNDNLTIFNQQGDELNDAGLETIDGNWADLLEQISEELDDDDRRDLRQAINDINPDMLNDPGVMWALSAYTEFSKGGAIEKLSALYYDADKAFPGDDVVVTTGYDKILGPLSKNLDIRLSTVTTAINYSGNEVTVESDQGPFKADYVICSVPLGVLKNNSIGFKPALPENILENIQTIGFGSVTKIAFKFQNAFWDTGTQYFGIMTKPKGRWNYWLNYRTFSDENVILGLSMGDYALTADAMTDQDMQQDALAVLIKVWGDDVGTPLETLTTHWSTDPFAFGAYAYPTPNSQPSQYDDLAEPIADKLFLCGEHTIFDYAGTVHGAYMSGLRAAENIIKIAT